MLIKLKHCLCLIFGHKTRHLGGGGYCERCGWGMFTEEYKMITHFKKWAEDR